MAPFLFLAKKIPPMVRMCQVFQDLRNTVNGPSGQVAYPQDVRAPEL